MRLFKRITCSRLTLFNEDQVLIYDLFKGCDMFVNSLAYRRPFESPDPFPVALPYLDLDCFGEPGYYTKINKQL